MAQSVQALASEGARAAIGGLDAAERDGLADAEIIGAGEAAADVELLCFADQLLQELGTVTEATGLKKNRTFSYQAYIDLLND